MINHKGGKQPHTVCDCRTVIASCLVILVTGSYESATCEDHKGGELSRAQTHNIAKAYLPMALKTASCVDYRSLSLTMAPYTNCTNLRGQSYLSCYNYRDIVLASGAGESLQTIIPPELNSSVEYFTVDAQMGIGFACGKHSKRSSVFKNLPLALIFVGVKTSYVTVVRGLILK